MQWHSSIWILHCAKADMMIRGGDPNNMRFGDTLSEDQFSGYQFQYIISNPPFGIDWKREKAAVEAEAKKAYAALGHKEDEIETLTLYIKPEERAVYYVVNGEGSSEYKIVY